MHRSSNQTILACEPPIVFEIFVPLLTNGQLVQQQNKSTYVDELDKTNDLRGAPRREITLSPSYFHLTTGVIESCANL